MFRYALPRAAGLLTSFAALPAFAQGAPVAGAPSIITQMLPLVVMVGIIYFLMIRPQKKKMDMHRDFLSKIKRGDEVLTSGGILGRVEGLTDMYITLEIAPDVRIKVLRTQIASYLPTAATGQEVKA